MKVGGRAEYHGESAVGGGFRVFSWALALQCSCFSFSAFPPLLLQVHLLLPVFTVLFVCDIINEKLVSSNKPLFPSLSQNLQNTSFTRTYLHLKLSLSRSPERPQLLTAIAQF